jgi:hypothetical protein
MTLARASDEQPLADEEVRAIGFEPTDEGWTPRTCVYCGGELRRAFARWTGAGGSLDVDLDCGDAFLREVGFRLVEAAREVAR